MGRPAKFSSEQILDAALSVISDEGPASATITAIAGQLGAPVGSIYHRFASRDLLLGHLWIRTVRRFQTGFITALGRSNDVDAAVAAATRSVEWAQSHPAEARILVLFRREELAARWPDELGEELDGLNGAAEDAMKGYAQHLWDGGGPEHLPLLLLAVVDLPYAAIRRYLHEDQDVPESVVQTVAKTCRFLLESV